MTKAKRKTKKGRLNAGNKKIAKEKSKKNNVKSKKQKEKIEKQILFSPRARLEPRLSLFTSEKDKKKQNSTFSIDRDKKLVVSLNTNEIKLHLERSNLKIASHSNLPSFKENNNEACILPIKSEFSSTLQSKSDGSNILPSKVDTSDSGYTSSSTSKLRASSISFSKPSTTSISSTKRKRNKTLEDIPSDPEDEEEFKKFIKESRHRVHKGFYWTDREIKDLADALQLYGFADLKKVADHIKTKTENDVNLFIKPRVLEARKAKCQVDEPVKQRGRPHNKWTTVSHENLETWPTIRKWKRLAYEQMLMHTRTQDYSRPVIASLCNKCYEEEPDPYDQQVIDVKLLYKYLADCMAGAVPAQLPPIESAVILDLLREVRLMPIAFDFEEERQFLKDFRKATVFKPFHVKDEFKKRIITAQDESYDKNAVAVPEEVFLELSRHKRLLQSFNPLVTPVWMIHKDQEHLEKYFNESSVYF